jgi:hypothetical protein
MLNYDIKRARAAVQYLVDSSYAKHRIKKLRAAVLRPRSMPFSGDAAPLNELLVIGRQEQLAMENLIALAEFKRKTHNDYQSAFMAAKRHRERLVIAIEETMLGRELSMDESVEALHRQYVAWNAEKADHIVACATMYRDVFSTEPNWVNKNAFIKDFWAMKDMELGLLKAKADDIAAKRDAPKKHLELPNKIGGRQLMDKLAAIIDRADGAVHKK